MKNVFPRTKRFSILIAFFLCTLSAFGVFSSPLNMKQALPDVSSNDLFFPIRISTKEDKTTIQEYIVEFEYKLKIQINEGITSLEDKELNLYLFGSTVIGVIVLVELSVIVGKQSEKWKKKSDEPVDRMNIFGILDRDSIIFESVQQYMEKNRCFETNKILPVLKSICSKTGANFTEHGIKLALKNLINSKCFVEGSKLIKNEVLNNPNRAEIYDYIKKNPGVHFSNITKTLNLNNYLTRWHLDVLLKFEYIWNENIGNMEVFFDGDIRKEDGRIIHLLSRDKVRLILDFIRKDSNGNMTKYRISKALNMHLNTVTKYVSLLENHEILKSTKDSKIIVLKDEFFDF
ncbi:MAG: hypothetical protein JW891_17175 [Candidatus Lokiarchaeota archaeon]|nr:hypothetical protein [Candidatus Lokiarchaeota archaeon]